jgi:hypothetical protein
VSSDNVVKRKLLNSEFFESTDEMMTVGGYFRRNYTFQFSASDAIHFFEFRFANWTNQGSINYWAPQVPYVDAHEACDAVCGNGICGEKDHKGTETQPSHTKKVTATKNAALLVR